MTVKPPDFRTLSDADVDAIAGRLRLLLSRPCLVEPDAKRKRIEIVPRRPDEVTPEQLRWRASVCNVTPGNAELQDMPLPMVTALLSIYEREERDV